MYNKLSKDEIERVFAEDVLGWEKQKNFTAYDIGNGRIMDMDIFHPLTDLNHAMMGMEKLIQKDKCKDIEMGLDLNGAWVHLYDDEWSLQLEVITKSLNEAIVEACIKIVRPDLFTED